MASRLMIAARIVWTVSIILLATTVGAAVGWNSHGLAGAFALGFVGLVIGVCLSSPQFLLHALS